MAHFAEQLANKTKKPASTKKMDARFVMLSELREIFEKEQAERAKKECTEALKRADKEAEDMARTT